MEKKFSLVSSVEKAWPNPPFIHRNTSKLSLGFFGLGRTKEDWHRQITDTAVDYLLLGPDNRPSPHFPWAQLQQYTDSYLKKKGLLSPLQQDDFLIGLVQKHAAKDVAIASCGHAISTQALRHMLQTDLRVEVRDPDLNLQANYLRLILVVDHVNPDVLSPMEVHCARHLLAASGTTTSSQTLAALIEIMATGMRTDNILFYHIQDLTRRSLSSFVVQLEQLRVDGKWTQAYKAVQWLSRFSPDSPGVSKEVTKLLDEAFKWHSWARWRPDLERLAKWNDFFHADQRTTLGHLLALEGPDYLENYATLREAQAHGTPGNVIYELKGFRLEELESVVTRLMQIIDATCTNISPADVPLLTSRCIGRIITHQDLQLLESLSALGDAFISLLVSQIYKAQKETRDTQVAAVIHLLPLLTQPRCIELRAICGQKIADIVNETLNDRKEELHTQLQRGRPWTGAEVNLQKFGLLLKKADWLWPLIHYGHLEALLQDWPSVEDLSNLHSIRLAVQNNANVVMPSLTIFNNYYLDTLVKRGTLDTDTRSTVKSLLNLWTQTTDWNRRYLGLLVAEGGGLSLPSPSQFINHLPNITIGQVNRFQSILATYKDARDEACIELVTILVNHSAGEVITYWRPILYSMIEERGIRLLDFALEKFNVEEWVEWLRNVRWALGNEMLFKQDLIQIEEDQARDPELATILDTPIPQSMKQNSAQSEGMQGQNFDILMTQKPEAAASSGKAPVGAHAAPSIRCPPALDPDLHQWSERLSSYLPIVSNLDKDIELGTARHCLLLGGDLALQQVLVQILSVLSFDIESHAQTTAVVHAIIPMLSHDGKNAAQLLETLTALTQSTDEGARACLQLMDFHKNNEPEVAEVMLAGWLRNSSLDPSDETALEALVTLIGVQPTIRGGWSDDSLKVVADYVDAQYALLMEEAARLDAMRLALKIKDPIGMSEFLESIGVEDVSPAEVALSDLPPHLINVVDKVGEREIEILFPLTHLTQLQRAAMGVDTAQSLVVRFIVGDNVMPPGFCIHLDTELKGNGTSKNRSSHSNSQYDIVGEHSPWITFPEDGHPDVPICHGKIVPAKYQLARVLSRHLSQEFTGLNSLEILHALVTDTLKGMGKLCITCSAPHGVNLCRPTVCKRPACNDIFLLANLEVRLADIRSDPAAVDLLLTMVFAAAASNNLQLLPNCPFTSTITITQILNTMPSMTALSTWKNLDSTINKLGPQAVQLLTWALSTYRGYLASATGTLKIPSMPPGTHQFILANASPEKESDFQAHIDRDPNTRLLFHGTSPDRLFAILCQGLQIKSNTSLQANGAASGAGIYMAEEPMTSWGYTTRRMMYTNWSKSTFRNFRVLLGCENAGPCVGNSSMHVIRDPSTVMVRYIFLIPAAIQRVPIKNHLDTAMMSTFRGLRSGAL